MYVIQYKCLNMKATNIITDLDRIETIVEKWHESGSIGEIERQLVLNKLSETYEQIMFLAFDNVQPVAASETDNDAPTDITAAAVVAGIVAAEMGEECSVEAEQPTADGVDTAEVESTVEAVLDNIAEQKEDTVLDNDSGINSISDFEGNEHFDTDVTIVRIEESDEVLTDKTEGETESPCDDSKAFEIGEEGEVEGDEESDTGAETPNDQLSDNQSEESIDIIIESDEQTDSFTIEIGEESDGIEEESESTDEDSDTEEDFAEESKDESVQEDLAEEPKESVAEDDSEQPEQDIIPQHIKIDRNRLKSLYDGSDLVCDFSFNSVENSDRSSGSTEQERSNERQGVVGNQPPISVLGEIIGTDSAVLGETMAPRVTDVADRISAANTHNLRQSIGLNDRYLIISELFGGDVEAYDNALDRLDSFTNIDDAMLYVYDNFNWRSDSEAAKLIMELLTRKLL